MCPHTGTGPKATSAGVLLYVCPHTSLLLYVCPHAAILLYMCPHTGTGPKARLATSAGAKAEGSVYYYSQFTTIVSLLL
jgi:hypothetical protein